MDPLRRLIEAVKAICPDADINYGPPLTATGSPTVRVLRTPGVPHPSFWVTFYDQLPPPRQYCSGGFYVDFDAVVTECLAFLREDQP